MKKAHMLVAIALATTAFLPDAHAQSGPSPRTLNWDWLEAAYEVAYYSFYSEEIRDKSQWAARARANIALFPNLHVTGSYDKQHFDAAGGNLHLQENLIFSRCGAGTHADFGPGSALVLEVVREEAGRRSHIEESGSQNQDTKAVIRGFGYYAGIRHYLGDTELELGYERSDLKDEIPLAGGDDPFRVKVRLGTLSAQLTAPLSKRLSATMRFEQLASRAKVDEDARNYHSDSSGHFENLLFGLRFAL